jgi:hypothetical protein
MRFTAHRPVLTPLGQRLLVLSERKLYDLDAPLGARESGTALLRAILVKETVRTAWSVMDEGKAGDLSDWSQPNAMGLDVIGEEEEGDNGIQEDEDDEEHYSDETEDQWFENLLEELGDEQEAGERTTAPDVRIASLCPS